MARPVNSLSYLFTGLDIEWFVSKALNMAARLDDREEKNKKDTFLLYLGQQENGCANAQRLSRAALRELLVCLLQDFSHNPYSDCAHFTFEQSMYHLTLYQSSDLNLVSQTCVNKRGAPSNRTSA